jgi:hypothetical protein
MITESRIDQIEAAALDYIERDPKYSGDLVTHHTIVYLSQEARDLVKAVVTLSNQFERMTVYAAGGWVVATMIGMCWLIELLTRP